MITRYGYDVVAVVALIVIAGSLLSWSFIDMKPLRYSLVGALVLLLLFTLRFFRDPDRVIPPGDDLVLSPADGKIVLIKHVHEDEYLEADAIQVSIFMSPFNVHVNRFPVNGRVGYFRYFPGDFLMAFDEKSSLRNERTHIGIESERGKILFKQIAGFIARRIIAEVQEGDMVSAGTRFGMIRFGSRVDMIIPTSAELKVKLGDWMVAGETVVAVVT